MFLRFALSLPLFWTSLVYCTQAQDVKFLWERSRSLVEKTEGMVTLQVQERDESDGGLKKMIQAAIADKQEVKSFKAEVLREGVRKQIIDELFRGGQVPSFCAKVKAAAIDFSESDLSAEKQQEKQEQADLRVCKQEVGEMFHGILFSDPATQMLVVEADQRKQVQVVVASFSDAGKELVYSLEV